LLPFRESLELLVKLLRNFHHPLLLTCKSLRSRPFRNLRRTQCPHNEYHIRPGRMFVVCEETTEQKKARLTIREILFESMPWKFSLKHSLGFTDPAQVHRTPNFKNDKYHSIVARLGRVFTTLHRTSVVTVIHCCVCFPYFLLPVRQLALWFMDLAR